MTVSTFIVLLDFVLLKILIRISKVRKATGLSLRLDRWMQDGPLQLQRRAFQAQRQGTWTELDEEIPVTATDEKLQELRTLSFPQPVDVEEPKVTTVQQSSVENFQPLVLILPKDDDSLFTIMGHEEKANRSGTVSSIHTEGTLEAESWVPSQNDGNENWPIAELGQYTGKTTM